MKLSQLLFRIAPLLLLVTAVMASAESSEAGSLRARGKFGYTFVTGTRDFVPHDQDEVSGGVDLTYGLGEHFGLGATVNRVFLASGSEIYVMGLTPVWGLTYERLHLYAGGLLGLLVMNDNYPAGPGAPTGPGSTVTVSFTRPVVGVVSGADVAIYQGLFANLAMQYAKSLGPEAKLGALGLTAGLGYQF